MKKICITVFYLTLGALALKAQDSKTVQGKSKKTVQSAGNSEVEAVDTANKPQAPGKFRFEEETHDFGEIMEGPLAECDFEFKNVGKSPIIISEAQGSCGCTVAKWPTVPIQPKRKGVIHVTYTTYGRVGPIDKDIYITSNADRKKVKLHLVGMILPKPEQIKKPEVPPPPPVPIPEDK